METENVHALKDSDACNPSTGGGGKRVRRGQPHLLIKILLKGRVGWG